MSEHSATTDLLAAVREVADAYRTQAAPRIAQLVVPGWMKKRMDALTEDELAELLAHVDGLASAMGFASWEMSVAPDVLRQNTMRP